MSSAEGPHPGPSPLAGEGIGGSLAAGTTAALIGFVSGLRFDALSAEVRHYAQRHLLDTVGVMIAGAGGDVATRAEAMLASVRPAGSVAAPGRARPGQLPGPALLGRTAAHRDQLHRC